MSRYRSENKNVWRSNKPENVDQPVTQVVNQVENKRRGTKLNLSELKPPQSFLPSNFNQKEQSEVFHKNIFFNKPKNVKNQSFQFYIKCIDKCCQVDDVISVLSFGGYSVKSKIDKPNQQVHNHRKLNKQTIYNFLQDEIPYLELQDFEEEIQNTINAQNKNEQKPKKEWKKSPFAPLFYTKLDNINHIERQTIHHQKRQKEIIQIHERNIQKQAENQKSKYSRNYSTYFGQKPLKQINNPQSGNQQINKSQQSNQIKNEQNSAFNKDKIKTRQQQRRLNNDDFEMSKPPQPTNKHCYPCKIKFDNYKEHIESNEHRLNVKKAMGSSLFEQQMKNLENMKKRQIDSQECKLLGQFANYLQKIVQSNDQYILKKHNQLRVNLRQINDEIERWLRM